MAKQTLPVNFKDDILNSSMGGKRRYNLIQNSDGTVSLEDVTSYTQVGSDFGAAQMNQTNKAVNESCDKANVIDDLDDIMANQANGKIAGAKSVATLNAYLSELCSVVEYDITDLHLKSAWEVRYADVHKIGRLVIMHMRIFAGTIVKNHEYEISNTIDANLIPSSNTPLCAVAGNTYMQDTVACQCTLVTEGIIKIVVPGDGKQYVDIFGTYITE